MKGATLSHYKILDELGRGGMGIVYRAEDTKLERTVAIKVLSSASLASDADRRRLYREAKSAAALHHPNIASVFEIDEAIPSDAPHDALPCPFIVMEFVEGLPLNECILAGDMALKTAGRVARQIASGLEAAHAKQIVHRDIKASNVIVTSKMEAKILDFGISRRVGVTNITKDGSTLGTISYMSPEQARGEPVDYRTDIWSLGVLLFELVGGRLPFRGVYEQAIIYMILNVDAPTVTSVRPGVPPFYDFIIGKCLEKDPDNRYQSASELMVDLKSVENVSQNDRSADVKGARSLIARNWRSTSLVALIALMVGILGTWIVVPAPADIATNTHFKVKIPAIQSFSNTFPAAQLVAISPAGTHVAHVDGGQIRIRALSSFHKSLLFEGEVGVRGLFFSPSGDRIGFTNRDGWLITKRIDGRLPHRVAQVGEIYGAHWTSSGEIVYAKGEQGIFSILANGEEEPIPMFDPDTDEQMLYASPQYFPEKRLLVYTKIPKDDTQTNSGSVYVRDLVSDVESELSYGNRHGIILSSGHFVFYSDTDKTLYAKPFDLKEFKVLDSGKWVAVVDSIQFSDTYQVGEASYSIPGGDVHYSVSDNGHLVYVPSDVTMNHYGRPVLVNSQHQVTQITEESGQYFTPAFHPDGNKMAMSAKFGEENFRIYLIDILSNETKPFTESTTITPVWSPDGDYIYYSRLENGIYNIYRKRADQSTAEEIVLEDQRDMFPTDISGDGKSLLIFSNIRRGQRDVQICTLEELVTCTPVVETTFDERNAVFSPNEKWIAYTSNSTKVSQIYLVSLEESSAPIPLTTDGGHSPEWSQDGTKIFYYHHGAIMSISLDTNGQPETPEEYFQSKWFPNYYLFGHPGRFQLHPDGDRFLLFEEQERPGAAAADIVIELNWFEELKNELAEEN